MVRIRRYCRLECTDGALFEEEKAGEEAGARACFHDSRPVAAFVGDSGGSGDKRAARRRPRNALLKTLETINAPSSAGRTHTHTQCTHRLRF